MWHTTAISCTRWFQICKFHAAETDSITSYYKLLLRTTRDQTVPQSVPRYCGVVQHRTPCYKILQGTTAYYQVLLGATKSNMVAFRATTQYKATVCTRKYSSLLQSFRLRSHVSQRIAPWLCLLQGPTRHHEVLDRTSPYYTEFDVVTPQLVAKLRIFCAQHTRFVWKSTTFHVPAIMPKFTKYCTCHKKWQFDFTQYCSRHEKWFLHD